jgi:hypothetical protein
MRGRPPFGHSLATTPPPLAFGQGPVGGPRRPQPSKYKLNPRSNRNRNAHPAAGAGGSVPAATPSLVARAVALRRRRRLAWQLPALHQRGVVLLGHLAGGVCVRACARVRVCTLRERATTQGQVDRMRQPMLARASRSNCGRRRPGTHSEQPALPRGPRTGGGGAGTKASLLTPHPTYTLVKRSPRHAQNAPGHWLLRSPAGHATHGMRNRVAW